MNVKLKNRLKKCLVLFLIANLGFGVQLAYSWPPALSESLLTDIGISESQFGLLFTIYSAPNMYMVILGGILIDIVGTNKVSTIFIILATVSSLITALATPNYKGLLAGRFLLGSGGEMLLSCAITMIPMWFSKKEVPLCMGFLTSWFYWGNLMALLILPRIRESFGLEAALWVIFAVFVFGFILNTLLIKFSDRLRWSEQKHSSSINELDKLTTVTIITRVSSVISDDDSSMDNEFKDMEISSGENSPRASIITTTSLEDGGMVSTVEESAIKEFIKRVIEIKDQVKKLSKRFWLLALICFFGYFTMFGFAIIGTDVLKTKFGYDEKTAANYMSAEAIVNSTLPIFTGLFIINLRGRKIQIMAFASFLLGLGVLLLNLTNVNPLPWIIICGIGFSLLNCTLMSCVPLLVDINIVGTAYGIVTTAYNCNIMTFPPILDAIKQATGNYTISLHMLTLSSVITISLLALLKYWDLQVPLSQSIDSSLTTINDQIEKTIDDSSSSGSSSDTDSEEIKNNSILV